MRARLRVQDFATGKNFSFNHCHNKEFCIFSRKSYFLKAIENFFQCLHSLIKTLEGLGEFETVMQTQNETPLVFISGYTNTEDVFYCLTGIHCHFQCFDIQPHHHHHHHQFQHHYSCTSYQHHSQYYIMIKVFILVIFHNAI